MNLKSVWYGVGAVFRKKIETHNFCLFPIIFYKKRSNLAMFSLSRVASLEHPFQSASQWLRHLWIMKTSSIFLQSIPVLKVNGSCIDLMLPNRKYSFKNTSWHKFKWSSSSFDLFYDEDSIWKIGASGF